MTVVNVTLAGREWPIPVLSIKQNRIVVPAVLGFMPTIARIGAAIAGQDKNPLWFNSLSLTTEDFDLMATAVYVALTKGNTGLSRNEFDNLEITLEELIAALPIVAQQTGLLKRAAGEPATGEAVAGAQWTLTPSSVPTVPPPEGPGQTS